MKLRFRFKIIAFLIAAALVGLVAFQWFWLIGFYDTLYKKMEADIYDAMKIADYKELFFRMEDIKEKQGRAQTEFKKEIPLFGDSTDVSVNNTPEIGGEIDASPALVGNDDLLSLSLRDMNLKNEVDSALFRLQSAIGGLESLILEAMHYEIDTVVPVKFHVYDSLLVAELKARNIEARYQLNLVHQINPTHTVFQILGKSHPGMNSDSTSAPLDWKDAICFDYHISPISKYHAMNTDSYTSEETISDPYMYRLYLKSPTRIILNQMSGILFSSFSVLVIIVITFIYLLHTILRQKTEEELKTDFTNNMTHELKTPISVSYAAVDSLLSYGDPVTEKQEKYLTIVKEQLTRLTGLVEQILTLSVENRKTLRLRPESLPVNDLVLKIIEQYKVKADEDIQFQLDIPSDIEVMADRTHLYNILSNLIDNALKYANKKPAIIQISAKKSKDEIRLSVTDNGPGISLAHQNRIFDKFYRIPSGNLHNVKGHGLGLYYVKDMMSKHGGSVSIDSTPDKGSTFTLHFIQK